MSENQNRQPKGIPVGGQYATAERGESTTTLDAPFEVVGQTTVETVDRDWGATPDVRDGSRTPWGSAQYAEEVVPGIVSVGTAGHGGVKLSPERNAAIPAPLRNRSGWYEEDCEVSIVGMYHPDAARSAGYYSPADQQRWAEDRRESVKDWFPDQYMAATGETLTPEDSFTLLKRAEQQSIADFRAEHAEEFVTLGNGDTHAAWIPDGYAACKARMDATGEERTFLLPKHEVIEDHSYGRHALVDPQRHLDVTDVVNTEPDRPWVYHDTAGYPVQTGDALCIDYHRLSTAKQVDRARTELEKQYRFRDDDGTERIESVADHLRRVGVVAKKPRMNGDKVEYWVEMPHSRVMKVSKVAYDAMTSVPDSSDAADQAYIAKEKARAKYEKARAGIFDSVTASDWRAKRDKAAAEYDQAVATYRELSEARQDQARAWQAERDQLQKDAFARLAAERDLSFDV